MLYLQTLALVRMVAAFCSGGLVDIGPTVSAVRGEAGGCPAASYFLLLRQKKVAKEKATPGSSPFGFPALLANAGRCGTRARGCSTRKDWGGARPQTVLADYPRICSAARRLSWGPDPFATAHAYSCHPGAGRDPI